MAGSGDGCLETGKHLQDLGVGHDLALDPGRCEEEVVKDGAVATSPCETDRREASDVPVVHDLFVVVAPITKAAGQLLRVLVVADGDRHVDVARGPRLGPG